MLSLYYIVLFWIVFVRFVQLSFDVIENKNIINFKRKGVELIENDAILPKRNRNIITNMHSSSNHNTISTKKYISGINYCDSTVFNIKNRNNLNSINASKNDKEGKITDCVNSNVDDIHIPGSYTINYTKYLNNMQFDLTTNCDNFESSQSHDPSKLITPYIIKIDTNQIPNKYDQLYQEASFSNATSASILMNNHINVPIADNVSISESTQPACPANDTLMTIKYMEDKKDQDFTAEKKEIDLDKLYFVSRKKMKTTFENLRRQNLSINQMAIMHDNYKFINDISILFNSRQIQSYSTITLNICTNLKSFLLNRIEMIKNKMHMHEKIKKNNRALPSRYIKNISKILYLCPFCSTHEFAKEDSNEIERQLIAEFGDGNLKCEVSYLIRNLFKRISDSFGKSFTPWNFFSSEFFLSQRIILEKILNIFDSHRLRFSSANRKKYLHAEYHKLFFDDIDMKIHFLPEMQSIIYVLLRTSSNDHLLSRNRNFMIAFYCFHSMNKFFDWIREFYEQNKIHIQQFQASLAKFTFHSLSFVLRVSFMEPLFSLLTIHQNVLFRYHLLSLYIYQNELLIFLRETNHNHVIASNSYALLPIIILIEKYTIDNFFDHYLEFNINELVKMNSNNVKGFILILNLMKETEHNHFKDQSDKLEIFIKSKFLSELANF